jgi:hypothetical protein
MPSAHAKLSPSASPRWLECPGSVHAESAAPDVGSAASDEGTACHFVAEQCLVGGKQPASFVGLTIKAEEKQRPVVFTEEMAGWVGEAIGWVRDYLVEHPSAILYTETEVDIGPAFGLPVDETGKTALWGTADFAIITAEELVVGDFKFGYRNVSVHTSQLDLYAMGLIHWLACFSFERVRKVIIQPRVKDEPEETVIEMAALDERREAWVPKIHAALDPSAPRVPGEKQCAWCKAAPICAALHAHTQRLAQAEFERPEDLTLEEVADVLGKASMIRAHLNAIETFAARMLAAGRKVPGWKLVRAKRNRVWKDTAGAIQVLSEFGIGPDRYLTAPELVSPAQAEKIIGKKGKALLEPYIDQPLGEPKLAPESDPRPAVAGEFEAWDEDAA